MADDDKELFDSALSNETEALSTPVETAPVTQPEETSPPRDEHGRFAPKEKPLESTQPAALAPQIEQPQTEHREQQGIPSWRLKEEADARRAAEERAANVARELSDMRRQLEQFQQQNKPPVQAPDLYEDPAAFVSHQVAPVEDRFKTEMFNLREYYSRKDAERAHGAEKVTQAREAIEQAARSGDPDAIAVCQRLGVSPDPYEDIVKWHTKNTVYSQIGNDPNAWLEKQLEERLKDPNYQAKLIERIRGNVQPGQRPITQLPPSLNKIASASMQDTADDDTSDSGLLKSALRR